MEKIHELLGYENIKIYQNDDMFRFSLDSTLLADFIDTKNASRIVDLCTGNAPIPLFLTMKTKADIFGVELQEEVYKLGVKSVEINNFGDQITLINNDLKGIYKELGANSFDIVSANPPYFKYKETSHINKNDYLTIARHEVMVTLEELVIEAKRLLVDGGRFYIVHRVNRLDDVIETLKRNKMGIKRIRFIYSKESSEEALSFLLEARKNKPSDIVTLKPIYVLDDNGDYTDEVRKIFNFKKII